MEGRKEGGKMQDGEERLCCSIFGRKVLCTAHLYTECNQYSGLHVLLNCFRLRSPAE